MTNSEGVRSQWYNALSKEDSQKVQQLLARHPNFLEVGWGDDASQFERKQPWKERTALHVGVKRGNAQLVQQVLVLCKVDIPTQSTMEEHDRGNPPSTSRKRNLAKIEEARKNDHKIAGPLLDDTVGESDRQPANSTSSAATALGKRLQKPPLPASNVKPVKKTGSTKGVRLRKAVSGISRSKAEGEDSSREISPLVIDRRKRVTAERRSAREQPKDQDDTLLRRLLEAKDGKSNLDAIAIAALHCNRKIFLLLLYAMRECKLHCNRTYSLPMLEVTEDTEHDRNCRAKIREATAQVVQSFGTQLLCYVGDYEKHKDFNFLPWEEYLFHFLFTRDPRHTEFPRDLARALWMAVRSCADSTWRFLLELQDGQGRTPFQVALLLSKSKSFEEVVGNDDGALEEEVVECVLAARDGAGRTAIHRALATGDSAVVSRLLSWYPFLCADGTNKVVSTLVRERWKQRLPSVVHGWTESKKASSILDDVSSANGFQESRGTVQSAEACPLHSAILHKRGTTVWTATQTFLQARRSKTATPAQEPSTLCGFLRKLLRSRGSSRAASEHALPLREQMELWQRWGADVLFTWSRSASERSVTVTLDAVELAALVGDATDAKGLPLGAYYLVSKLDSPRTKVKQPWPALHIAANAGNYEMVKMFLDAPGSDPYIEDWNGNTALHHALNVVTIGKFEPHLFDYVDCKHLQSNDARKGKKIEVASDDRKPNNNSGTNSIGAEDPLVDRQGCINLLLEAGCDIFKTNRDGQPPFPQGELSRNSTFRSWWYHRQAKEFDTTQRTLSSAANAISVTAALVATASYVGPLQPPMGVAGDPSQIQDANLWVRLFIFCDTMSFYFAIVSITLSLIPSMPVPQQKMKDEVSRTRWMVAMSVTILFPSIICVLVAFVASSMAIVSADVTSIGGWLTMSTASIGGLFCLVTFNLFFIRLLAFVFPKSKQVRKLYNVTNWTGQF